MLSFILSKLSFRSSISFSSSGIHFSISAIDSASGRIERINVFEVVSSSDLNQTVIVWRPTGASEDRLMSITTSCGSSSSISSGRFVTTL